MLMIFMPLISLFRGRVRSSLPSQENLGTTFPYAVALLCRQINTDFDPFFR